MRLRWLLAAAVIALVPAGIFGKRTYDAHRLASEQLAECEQAQVFARKLGQPVEFNFGKAVPLRIWLDEWGRQTGISAVVPPESGVAAEFDNRQPVALDLPRVPARAALQALCELHDLQWYEQPNDRIEIHLGKFYWGKLDPPAQAPLATVTYAIPDCLAAASHDELIELLTSQVEPDSWSDVGGRGSVVGSPGQLHVVQEQHLQPRISSFLRALQMAAERSLTTPSRGVLPDDVRWQPLLLCEDAEPMSDLLRRLDQPVTLDLVDVRLPEFVERFGQAAGISLRLDYEAVPDLGLEGPPLTCRVRDMRARHALTLALGGSGFDTLPIAGGRALLVTAHDKVWNEERRLNFAYPVRDLIENNVGQRDFDPLIMAVTILVEPDGWRDMTGPGSVNGFGDDFLIATVPLQKHWEIQELLTTLRRVRSGAYGPRLRVGFDSGASKRMLTAYEQLVELSYYNRTLLSIVNDLRERCGLPIHLYAGVRPDLRVTCHLPARRLRENLRLLLNPLGLGICLQAEYLEVSAISDERQVTEVCDVRPIRRREHRLPQFVRFSLFDSWDRYKVDNLTVAEVRELLIMRQIPEVVETASDLVQFVRSGLHSNKPQWPGRKSLSAIELNSLVPVHWSSAAADEAALKQKLLRHDSLSIDNRPMGEILWELACRHDLPLPPVAIPKGCIPKDAIISYHGEDEPVALILRKLIGSPESARWDFSGGTLRVTTDVPLTLGEDEAETVREEHRFYRKLYFVGDLIKHRGRFTEEELSNFLRDKLLDETETPAFDSTHLVSIPYFDCVLLVYGKPDHHTQIEKYLRELRQTPPEPQQ